MILVWPKFYDRHNPSLIEPDVFMTVIVQTENSLSNQKLPSSARVLVNLLDGEVLLFVTKILLLLSTMNI